MCPVKWGQFWRPWHVASIPAVSSAPSADKLYDSCTTLTSLSIDKGSCRLHVLRVTLLRTEHIL